MCMANMQLSIPLKTLIKLAYSLDLAFFMCNL